MWLASVDGVVTPAGDARIPVTDEGLLRGDGGFEVLRVYGGRPYALDDHFARLGRTCAGLRLEADLDALRSEALAVVRRSPSRSCGSWSRAAGRRIAIGEPLPAHGATARVATITYAPTRVLNRLKTLSYAANMLAVRLAKEQGADEALLVTPHGRVLEGPTWTFFWAAGGTLYTPPLEDGILDSITRTQAAGGVRRHRGAVHARRRPRGRRGVHRLNRPRGDADRGGRRDRAAEPRPVPCPRRRVPRSGGASRAICRLLRRERLASAAAAGLPREVPEQVTGRPDDRIE